MESTEVDAPIKPAPKKRVMTPLMLEKLKLAREKAIAKKKEMGALTKKEKDVKEERLKTRAKAVEIAEEETKTKAEINTKRLAKVTKKAATALKKNDLLSSSSSESESSSSSSSEEEVKPKPKRKPVLQTIKKASSRRTEDLTNDVAKEVLRERIRHETMKSAFSSLFPGHVNMYN